MAVSVGVADGQLAVATGVLYTCPGSTEAVVIGIVLVNTDTVSRTINLFRKVAGTNRLISPEDQSLAPGASYDDNGRYTLEAGDTIEGDASAATVVDYSISIIEKA